jgi:hypothetical protein
MNFEAMYAARQQAQAPDARGPDAAGPRIEIAH